MPLHRADDDLKTPMEYQFCFVGDSPNYISIAPAANSSEPVPQVLLSTARALGVHEGGPTAVRYTVQTFSTTPPSPSEFDIPSACSCSAL
jgi:hypothetical protein